MSDVLNSLRRHLRVELALFATCIMSLGMASGGLFWMVMLDTPTGWLVGVSCFNVAWSAVALVVQRRGRRALINRVRAMMVKPSGPH